MSLRSIEIEDVAGKYLLLSGYRSFDEGFQAIGNTQEEFAITNRNFKEVDMYFAQQISCAINEV
jgi:hypothetical protein